MAMQPPRSRSSAPAAAKGAWCSTAIRRSAIKDATGQEIASWLIDVVPDAVPTVSFVGEPRATHRSVLRIDLEAADDYGVAELALLLAPAGPGGRDRAAGLLKPGNQPPKLATGTYLDLTAHPFAGCRWCCASRRSTRSASAARASRSRSPCRRASSAIRWHARSLRSGASWWPSPKSDEVAARLAARATPRRHSNLPVAVPLGLRRGCAASGDQ